VNKIFIFWDNRPWGDIRHCVYKGQRVKFPKKFDNTVEKIRELENPKVVLKYDHVFNNINQFTHLVRDKILPENPMPEIFIMMEVDFVFRQDQAEKVFDEFRASRFAWASTSQAEIWKGFNYIVPKRNSRKAAILWNMKKMKRVPDTGRHADPHGAMPHLKSYVHNLGFAVSEHTMYWKFLIGWGNSNRILEDLPVESWFEEKWLNWKPGIENLEGIIGCEHHIPYVEPYNVNDLPKSIREKIGKTSS
jgi:hypothetical protein